MICLFSIIGGLLLALQFYIALDASADKMSPWKSGLMHVPFGMYIIIALILVLNTISLFGHAADKIKKTLKL
jgi:pyrrolidone-carboxylate peptidase